MPKNVNTSIPSPPPEGTGVFCYQFEIPDTLEWHRTAYVTIAMLTRGRYWDADTGNIKDVQQLGYDVLASLQPCGDTPPIIDIQTIEKIIQNFNNEGCCDMGCCCQNQQGEIITNTPSTEETSVPPAEQYTGAPEQEITTIPIDVNYEDWKCKSAKYMVDVCIAALQEGGNLVDIAAMNTTASQGIATGTFGSVEGGDPYVASIVDLLAFTTWFIRWASPAMIAAMVAFVERERNNLVNGIFCSESAQESADIWYDILVVGQPNLIYKAWMFIAIKMIPFEAFYQDSVTRMTAPAYETIINNYTNDCDCGSSGGSAGLPADYELVPMIPNAIVNVNGGSVTTLAELWEFMGQGNSFVDVTLNPPQWLTLDVPNANRVGFHFELDFSLVPNGNSVSQRLSNSSTQFTQVNFGGGGNTFLDGEVFAGVISSDATMQTWLTDNVFRWEDNNCSTDTGDVVTSWGIDSGTTSSGLFNEFVLKANWIIYVGDL